MPNHTSLASLFTDIADAIRGKTGGSAQLVADDFPTAIAAIPSLRVATASKTLTSVATSISFTDLPGSPLLFYCFYAGNLVGTSVRVSSVLYDGNSCQGYNNSNTTNGKINHSTAYYSYTYSNGTLTIRSSSPYFNNVTYQLILIY